jgi:DNA-binding transcriptional LysR family regulator
LGLVRVAEERQFTRAATRVSVAQPAVSAQIRRLEGELGQALFHRDQRAVRLTAACEALLPHARAALAAADRAAMRSRPVTQEHNEPLLEASPGATSTLRSSV